MESHKGALSWTRTCYGVDIESDPPVVVRAERTRSGIRTAVVSLSEALLAAADGAVFAGCVPARESFVKVVRAPYGNLAKSRKVFSSLLDVELPFPIEECVCEFMAPEVLGDRTEALATGCRTNALTRRLESYRALGFDPASVDLKGLAAWAQARREWPASPDATDRVRAVVLLSAGESLLVLGSGRRPDGIYCLRPRDEAAHVRHLLRARTEPGTPVDWFWAGDSCTAEEHQPLRADCESACPGRSAVANEPQTFLARALAIGALSGGPYTGNLRTGIHTHPQLIRRIERRSRGSAFAALAAGLVLCAGALFRQTTASRYEAQLDRRLHDLASSLTGYPVIAKGEQAYALAAQAVEARVAACRPFYDTFAPSLTPRLLDITRCATENGLRLGSVSLTPDSAAISGTSGSWKAVDPLKTLLSRYGCQVVIRREDARDDGRIPFSVVTEDHRD
jgi:hypothetical protein